DDTEHARLIEEGMWWARIAQDKLQEALLYQISAWRNIDKDQRREALADYRRGVEAAVEGGYSAMVLELRSRIIELLLHASRAEEAETEAGIFLSFIDQELNGDEKRFYLSRHLRYMGIIASLRDNQVDAIRYLEDALNHADETIDPVHYGAILFRLANAHHSIDDSARAIELLVELGEVGKRSGRQVLSANAFARIGEIYLEDHESKRADKAFKLAERFVSYANLPILRRTIQYQKLPLYLQSHSVDEGITLCRELLDHYKSGAERIKVLRTLGLLLEKNNSLPEAESVLRDAYGETGEKSLLLGIPLARILIARKRDEEGHKMLLSLCENPPERKADMSDYVEGLELLSDIAQRKGEYDDALNWLRKAYEARISIERSKNEKSIRNAQILADLKVREGEEELVRARRERTEEELAELLTGLQVTHGTLLRIEQRLRENLVWLEPEQIEQVIASLKSAMTDPETEQAVELVLSEADALLGLHGVDEAFFDALRAEWPNLTKKQQQICGMIRAGLDTSQIAYLLGITQNAVLTQRKRMRKRMALSSEENLKEIIMGIRLAES
ncbi:MAG: LuxR C-terminal-related transcriptional regulator, partial [Candidatus Kapaibacterium sp.]